MKKTMTMKKAMTTMIKKTMTMKKTMTKRKTMMNWARSECLHVLSSSSIWRALYNASSTCRNSPVCHFVPHFVFVFPF